MSKEIKIGDWGWLWDDKPDNAFYNQILEDWPNSKYRYLSHGRASSENFSHEHPTGKFKVVESLKEKFAEAGAKADPYTELKQAVRDGKIIQYSHDKGISWQDMNMDVVREDIDNGFEFIEGEEDWHRIKPEPKYVPFSPEEGHFLHYLRMWRRICSLRVS